MTRTATDKRAAFASVVDAFAPKPADRLDRRAFWELRHARLRLALAENELAWAQEAMTSGYINPAAALAILNATMDGVMGMQP